MSTRARIVDEVLELLADACDIIKENDQCSNCPMRFSCINDRSMSLYEHSDTGANAWDEFIDFADNCVPSETLAGYMNDARVYDEYRDARDEREYL